MSIQERLLKHSHQVGECRIWHGCKVTGGYGMLTVRGRGRLAHHISWIEHHGGEPIGYDFCHTCDTPACINPDHIWVGTTAENMADMAQKGRNRQPRGEAHNKAKLTVAQVREIYTADGNGPEISRRFGIDKSTVYSIKSGVTWAHVTGHGELQ